MLGHLPVKCCSSATRIAALHGGVQQNGIAGWMPKRRPQLTRTLGSDQSNNLILLRVHKSGKPRLCLDYRVNNGRISEPSMSMFEGDCLQILHQLIRWDYPMNNSVFDHPWLDGISAINMQPPIYQSWIFETWWRKLNHDCWRNRKYLIKNLYMQPSKTRSACMRDRLLRKSTCEWAIHFDSCQHCKRSLGTLLQSRDILCTKMVSSYAFLQAKDWSNQAIFSVGH